ncbi:autotransporter domain-containing protein [Dongia sp.]|uniref:autotransporter family protein n=1 Tax=Dongia sp. TaxID=1977262 RepID=UPI0035AF9AFF
MALIAALPAGSARADCTTPTTNGQVVICTGSDTDAFSSNYDGLFIKVLKGASVTGPFWGINIGGDNVDIVVNGSVTDGSGPFNAIGSNGQYTNVILKNGALVQALHNNTTGIRLQGANGQVTMKDQAHVLTNGTNTVGVLVNSVDDAKIALRDKSSISANGAAAAGILTSGERTQIDINDQGHISANGADAAGIWLKGNYGVVNINDDGSITANGNAVGVAIEGDANELLLNDHSRIQVDSATGNGISILGASSNGVTIGKDAVIQTTGSNTRGISIGSGSTQNSITNYGLIDSVDSAIVDSNGVAIVTNSGTIISKNAVAIKLGGGDDVLSLKTGSQIVGDVDGGAGSDSLQLGGSGTEDADFLNFEYLMVGYPVSFNAVEHWTLAGNSAFATAANLYSGLLSVNGTITTPIVNVDDIAALGGNGRIVGNVTSAGKIAPGNSVGTLTIVGAVTQNGGGFEAEFDENGVDLLTATGNVTLTNSPALNVKALGGAGGANGTIIHSDTSITGSLAAPKYEGNGAATLLQNTNDITLLAVDGTPLVASNYATLESGLDFLSTVAGQQIEHRSACLDNTCAVEGGRRLWGNAYGRFGSESADDGNLPFEYRTAGTALGGDIDIADGFTLGGALGYGNTMAKPGEGGARTDADEELLAIYGNYEAGSFFMSGFLNAGLQQFDISREVSTNGGTDTARAETDGWLAGGGVQAGMKLDFPGGWRLTPSAGALYQHQSVNGYQEKGAGEGNVSFGRQTSDALRLQAQLDVARTLPFEDVTLIPYLQLGALGQMNFGDDVPGSFANGTDFAIALQDDHSGAVILGAGMDFEFMNGVSATVGYRAEHASETDHMLRAGISVKW